LFIGFLRGVPFWWTLQQAWQPWLLCIGLLLAVFYILDSRGFKKVRHSVQEQMGKNESWSVRGLWNVLPLAAVLSAVFLDQKLHLGPFSLTALVMIVAALVSYCLTPRDIHAANDFSFGPVKEVGWLFIGIFLTMIPALELLQSGQAGAPGSALQYYLSTGALSAFLDNAPTYLAFLATSMGQVGLDVNVPAEVLQHVTARGAEVLAVSLGAVFFGAGSYIGNGPNFMVKAIAEKAGVHTPSFMRYIVMFSLPILLPILLVVGWVFLR
jgi:Na+/H+ antiporter NhaD/arsenite permease-like protein